MALILIVPRDDTSRIPRIDYAAVAAQASEANDKKIVSPKLPEGWWSNQATWLGAPVDAVSRFEVGFVGPKNEYIGMTHAFGINETWLALSLRDVVLENEYQNSGSETMWSSYRSPEINQPPKTRDVMWVTRIGDDAILLYGTATEKQFETFTRSIETELKGTQ